jgi:hypothetical protein
VQRGEHTLTAPATAAADDEVADSLLDITAD